MNKRNMEILSSVGSVILLTILFILVHQNIPQSQEYGFVAALVVFIVVVSLMGLKLTRME
jgi:amino acid permease